MKKTVIVLMLMCMMAGIAVAQDDLAAKFANPPDPARPWVYWFWINGNISKEGITADLEALHRAGIRGVLWMEVSGLWWAPDGEMKALSPQWHECMRWAVKECARLGMEFDISVDFGYGCGGRHITPELSMQKLYWHEMEVEGGKQIDLVLPKPNVPKTISAWLRPGADVDPTFREQIQNSDSYRDIAVMAVPVPASKHGRAYRIPDIDSKNGVGSRVRRKPNVGPPPTDAITPVERVVDLTGRMAADGRLVWDAPAGKWLILRCGHASNFKMTRPCPAAAVGLECDRLSTAGIEAHYKGFLKQIFEGAGAAAGKALTYVHIDSWEAGGQNWTAAFPEEFRKRRGYDVRPWLPVLAGRLVGSLELSERFLWDMRTTAGELTIEKYAARLRELSQAHGIKLSIEAYGGVCVDDLVYAGICDMPMSEFWAQGTNAFPSSGGYEFSTKAIASAAHVYGKPVIGAESFTSGRGWRDHPFLLKAMGDGKFCEGLNRMIFHLSAHQAYDNMIPGLTHRQWGEHFQRHNTWWGYVRPWIEYLSRCQYMLQQGEFAGDVCYWFGEGAPLSVNDMRLEIPEGYDFDLCSSEIVRQMSVRDGRVVLPSGLSYRYLLLPDSDRMTLPLAQKIRELVNAGARVIGAKRPKGTPGLTDFPRCDAELEKIAAALWDKKRVISGKTLGEVFAQDKLLPDFEGGNLRYIHRRAAGADIYFVSHQENCQLATSCTFRVTGKCPELWDPETGDIRGLPEFADKNGRTTVPLRFEPMQSWFVVFRNEAQRDKVTSVFAQATPDKEAQSGKNFHELKAVMEIAGAWDVQFDPKWGGPNQPVTFDKLEDWSKRAEEVIRYFSGTAVYRKAFQMPGSEKSAFGNRQSKIYLDLGQVEVMARVRLNGKDCGIAWKPPYRVDITHAVRDGKNDLEIDVVNLWINRLIGDEQLPLDGEWENFETLMKWPEWFKSGQKRSSGRYTFTTCRHYKKDSPLVPSGLLGPVRVMAEDVK
jgi:hypothetical protein